MVSFDYGREFDVDSLQSFFGKAFSGRKVSEDTIVFYANGCDFLREEERWKKVRNSSGESSSLITPAKTLYSADGNVLFVERPFSRYGVRQGIPRRLYELSKKRFRGLRLEEPIGFRLKNKGRDVRLYHLHSQGLNLDEIGQKTPQGIRKELAALLGESTQILHNSGIQYYPPFAHSGLDEPFNSDICYVLGKEIVYGPHQFMRFGEITQDGREEELSSALYHFHWIGAEEAVDFLWYYYGKASTRDEIMNSLENVRKKAVAIHGAHLRSHGIFYLTEQEKRLVQAERELLRLRQRTIMTEVRREEKRQFLEDYLKGQQLKF